MIKKLLYCGLMLLTINTFALQINWDNPKQTFNEQETKRIINKAGEYDTLIVGEDRLVYLFFGKSGLEYKVYSFDDNNNINLKKTTKMPMSDVRDIISKFGSIDNIKVPFFTAIPNSNKFIEVIYNYPEPIKTLFIRVATLHEDNSITWTPLQALPDNVLNGKDIDIVYPAVTENGHVVLIGKHWYGELPYTEILCAYGKLINDNITWLGNFQKLEDINLEYGTDSVYSLKDGYFIVITRFAYIIGQIDDNGKLEWGKQNLLTGGDYPYVQPYVFGSYIKHLDKFALPNNMKFYFYNINYQNKTLLLDPETEPQWLEFFSGFARSHIKYLEKSKNVFCVNYYPFNKNGSSPQYHTIGTFSDNLPSDAPLKGKGL